MGKNVSCARKSSVGGQALIEGIMMNGPKGSAIAVRKSDGSILVEPQTFKHVKDKYKILGVPFIRGIVNYIETMVFGYKCLMRSADLSGQLEAEESPENMSKLDRWLNDHMGPKLLGVLSGIAMVLSVVIGIALFEGILRAAIIVLYMFAVSRLKDIHRVFMYHGAEHKTIACYESGKELTVENVRSCKRFHPRCGTSFIFIIIIVSIIISSIVLLLFPALGANNGLIRLIWVLVKIVVIIPVVTGISYEMIKYAGKHDNIVTKIFSAPGLWMQRITTAEPTDEMMEIGIASLKAVITDDPSDDTIQ